jgi:hypothetical protein
VPSADDTVALARAADAHRETLLRAAYDRAALRFLPLAGARAAAAAAAGSDVVVACVHAPRLAPLAARYGDRAVPVAAAFCRTVRACLHTHGGVEVDADLDSFVLSFATCAAAVRCPSPRARAVTCFLFRS